MTQAEAVHSTECPVAPLARDAMKINAAFYRAMERDLAARGPRKVSSAFQVEVLKDRLTAIEGWASQLKAESALGAMFQVHLLHEMTLRVEEVLPDDAPGSRETDQIVTTIRRLCYSLRGFIAAVSDVRPEDAGGDYYMPPSHDPFAAAETAFAERSLSA